MGRVAIRIHLSPGMRALRRGDEGEDVRRLQEKLASFGYDVGEIDGRFGFLTEDALVEFQRDHRLRPDGIAGPKVWAALDARLPQRRVVHEVAPGERLADVARRYGVSPDAIRWMNGMKSRERIVPGRRLVLRSSYVLAGIAPQASASALRSLAAERGSVSALVLFAHELLADGTLSGEVDAAVQELVRTNGWPLAAGLRRPGEAGGDLASVLGTRRLRRRLIQSLAERFDKERWNGLFLDIGPVPLGMGAGLLAGIASLRRAFPEISLTVAVAAPYEGWRALVSDFDYAELAKVADRVALSLHRWDALLSPAGEPPHRELVERWVGRTARAVPPWKVLLGVPMGACRVEPFAPPVEVGYRAAVAAGLSARRRPKADERGFLELAVDRGEAAGRYLTAGREILSRWLGLAFRHRLAGLFLYPVGLEDRRLWEIVSRRVWAQKGDV